MTALRRELPVGSSVEIFAPGQRPDLGATPPLTVAVRTPRHFRPRRRKLKDIVDDTESIRSSARPENGLMMDYLALKKPHEESDE